MERMETLLQKFSDEINNHGDFWNYYNQNFGNILENTQCARKFIYRFFANGGKDYILDEWINEQDENIGMRNLHTVNVFFIGVYLQRKIDENLKIKSRSSEDYKFSYIWYLLCLAHDLGYEYENCSQMYLNMRGRSYKYRATNNYRMHSDFQRTIWYPNRLGWYRRHALNIVYTFSCSKNICDTNRIITYSNGVTIKKARYSQRLINNYFFYRLYGMEKLDHGIVGADYFYSKMIINYVNQYKKVFLSSSVAPDFYGFYNSDGLYFCVEQIKIFEYISDCIAAHNVYVSSENDEYKYREYGLEPLLQDNFEKIDYNDNPLLFILCVADTIEPGKRFAEYRNTEILDMIRVNYDEEDNMLCVEVDNRLDFDAARKYVENVRSLERWCNIKVKVEIR